jgi:hypothetical protein
MKIRTVIERVGVTDMAVDIIIDLVARGLGKLGGRPPNGLGTRYKPVSKPNCVLSGDLFSVSDLLPESPDPSKPNPEEDLNIMEAQKAGALRGRPSNRFLVAMRQFAEVWETHYGVPYAFTPGDRNQLGRLMKDLTVIQVGELRAAFEAYLDDLAPYVAQEQRHSLRFFCTSGGFNKYRVSAPVVSRKEAMGIEAGQRFVNGEGNHAGKR